MHVTIECRLRSAVLGYDGVVFAHGLVQDAWQLEDAEFRVFGAFFDVLEELLRHFVGRSRRVFVHLVLDEGDGHQSCERVIAAFRQNNHAMRSTKDVGKNANAVIRS